MRNLLIRTAFAAVAFSAVAAQAAAPAMTAETAKGPALVDAKNMTLYTFDKDMGGKSMCNGPCAANWPALTAASDRRLRRLDDGDPGRRHDAVGLQGQAALHLRQGHQAGDTTGDGFLNGAWHIAKP